MSRRQKVAAVTAAALVVITSLTGCASKTPTAAKPTNTAAAVTVDVAMLKPTLAQWMRYSGVLQYLRDTNSVLLAMQKTAQIKITDSKSLATYITQLKASGGAAIIVGRGIAGLKSPDASLNANTAALGNSMITLGTSARALDAVAIAKAGKAGAAAIKTVLVQLGDSVTKTKALAQYASAHAKDPITSL